MTEPVRQTAERALRRFAPPLYRWLQRRSGQRLAKRFGTAEERFQHIYKSNHWSEAESVSGPGSTLEETEPLRRELPSLLRELGATSMLDLPCGDFHWMQHTNLAGIDYIGGDLVGSLIDRNQAKHACDGVEFRKIDLVNDTLPAVDVILCRDCLVHLSFADAQVALANVARLRGRVAADDELPECRAKRRHRYWPMAPAQPHAPTVQPPRASQAHRRKLH